MTAEQLDRVRPEPIDVEPRVISGKVTLSPSTYYAAFAVSENSTLVYSIVGSANHSQLTWFDEMGRELGRAGPTGVLALAPGKSCGARQQ
jgi:hypothetical protein